MHEVAVHVEGADLQKRAGSQPDCGLVGHAQRIDVALPVVGHVQRVRRLRRGERREFRHFSRYALAYPVGVEIDACLGVLAQPVADVETAARALAPAMVTKAVELLGCPGDEIVDRTGHAARADGELVEPEAAKVHARAKQARVVTRRHHEIDGAAERVGAEAQGIGTFVDLDVAVGGRIDLLEVAEAVGGVDRDAVHVELQPAQMEVAREPGPADGEARVVAPLGLRKHARHVVERVLDGG